MRDAIKIISQILFFYTITFMAVRAYGDTAQMPVYGVFIFILTLYCYLQRKYVERKVFFVCGHIAAVFLVTAAVWSFNIPKGFAALIILMIVFSLLVRWFPEIRGIEEPGYFQLGVLALIFFQSRYWWKFQGVKDFSFSAFLVMLLLMILYDNLKAADLFIQDRKYSTRMDEKKLKRSNNLFSLLYTGMLVPVLLLVSGFQTDGISRFFGRLISMILGLIPIGEPTKHIPEEYVPMEGVSAEPSLFIKILLLLLKAAIAIGLIAGAVCFIIRGVKAICHRFSQRTEIGEDIEEYAEPLTVSKRIFPIGTKGLFKTVDQSPSRRVRRMYKKSFRNVWHRTGKELQNLSPKEQMAAVDIIGEKAEELLEIYEKARYSKAEVTEEDVKRMKDITRSLFLAHKTADLKKKTNKPI